MAATCPDFISNKKNSHKNSDRAASVKWPIPPGPQEVRLSAAPSSVKWPGRGLTDTDLPSDILLVLESIS